MVASASGSASTAMTLNTTAVSGIASVTDADDLSASATLGGSGNLTLVAQVLLQQH